MAFNTASHCSWGLRVPLQGLGPELEGSLWPALHNDSRTEVSLGGILPTDMPQEHRALPGCGILHALGLTCAGADVLGADRLTHQVVLVQPGAIFCHHH